MKKNISFFSLLILPSMILTAQHILNAKKPSDIRKMENEEYNNQDSPYYDEPLPYGEINEKDIMWSRSVWETIDLNEKINLLYYFPIDSINIDIGRISLFDALMKGITDGEITEVFQDSYFRQKLTIKELQENLVRLDTLDLGIEQANAGEEVSQEYIDRVTIASQDIKMYKIRGMWYFDKRIGELRYRLLGIAPVAKDVYQSDIESDADLVELFWVWYPNARNVLHKHKVFNQRNASASLSYDDLLNARRFNSLIYKVQNKYGDREIRDYYQDNATLQILEAMRLKEEIRNFENDQWVY